MGTVKAHRIDVHFHPTPPGSLAGRGDISANARRGWSMEKSLADMEEGGVARAMLSLPHPASTWTKDAGAGPGIARQWNEYLAGIARDHVGRFGVFATLPINDVEGSLRELEYAFDTLKVDGIHLMTNMGDRWLGDPH